MKYEEHNFYCLNCGNRSIPLMRKSSNKKALNHRKKLYCPWCKTEVNHIELTNMYEIEKFKQDFADGMYIQEAKESIAFLRG